MGEYAEMMLDGTCCGGCGEFFDDDHAPGYPRYCSPGCASDRGVPVGKVKAAPPAPKPCICGTCGKPFVSKGARKAHRRAKHLSPASPRLGDGNAAPIEGSAAGRTMK
jgi:hypothetical protein